MSKIDLEIRYGLAPKETAEIMPESEHAEDLSVRVFPVEDDWQWCLGILTRRSIKARTPLKAGRDSEPFIELGQKIAAGRKEGRVPFRVAGDRDKIPPF